MIRSKKEMKKTALVLAFCATALAAAGSAAAVKANAVFDDALVSAAAAADTPTSGEEEKISLAEAEVKIKYASFCYTGKEITPGNYNGTDTVTVTLGEKTLKKGTDYEISYENNISVGFKTAKVIVTGINDYEGEAKAEFSVSPQRAEIASLTTKNDGIIVTWDEREGASGYQILYSKDKTFKTGCHTYTVQGRNNVNLSGIPKAGETYYIKVRAFVTEDGTTNGTRLGAYSNVDSIKCMDNLRSASAASCVYTGKERKPAVTVKGTGGVLLKAGTDYTTTYTNNINVGTGTVTITGIGKYQGTLVRNFKINPYNLTTCKVEPTIPKTSYTYTGSAINPVPSLTINGYKLVAGKDYTVTYVRNVNVGTPYAKVLLWGKGNYTGRVYKVYKITPQSLSSGTVTIPSNYYEYLGSPITPKATVTFKSKTLKLGTDYTVSYKNNNAPGTATITVKGCGNYTGSISHTYALAKVQGFRVMNGKTYLFDLNGNMAKSGWVQGYQFDSTGAMTEESLAFKKEVDDFTNTILKSAGMENGTMYQKLSAIFYNYYKYMRYDAAGAYYRPDFSSPKWEMTAAKLALRARKGNCYKIASLYSYMARSVGYYAISQYQWYIVSPGGYTVRKGDSGWPHCWTEIYTSDGTKYNSDPEYYIEQYVGQNVNLFLFTGNRGPGKLTYYYKRNYY